MHQAGIARSFGQRAQDEAHALQGTKPKMPRALQPTTSNKVGAFAESARWAPGMHNYMAAAAKAGQIQGLNWPNDYVDWISRMETARLRQVEQEKVVAERAEIEAARTAAEERRVKAERERCAWSSLFDSRSCKLIWMQIGLTWIK